MCPKLKLLVNLFYGLQEPLLIFHFAQIVLLLLLPKNRQLIYKMATVCKPRKWKKKLPISRRLSDFLQSLGLMLDPCTFQRGPFRYGSSHADLKQLRCPEQLLANSLVALMPKGKQRKTTNRDTFSPLFSLFLPLSIDLGSCPTKKFDFIS